MTPHDPAEMTSAEILAEMTDITSRAWLAECDRKFWHAVVHGVPSTEETPK
jgi:hypothetical protein